MFVDIIGPAETTTAEEEVTTSILIVPPRAENNEVMLIYSKMGQDAAWRIAYMPLFIDVDDETGAETFTNPEVFAPFFDGKLVSLETVAAWQAKLRSAVAAEYRSLFDAALRSD